MNTLFIVIDSWGTAYGPCHRGYYKAVAWMRWFAPKGRAYKVVPI